MPDANPPPVRPRATNVSASDLATFWERARKANVFPLDLHLEAIGEWQVGHGPFPIGNVEHVTMGWCDESSTKMVDITLWASAQRGPGGMIGIQVSHDFPVTFSTRGIAPPIRTCKHCKANIHFSPRGQVWSGLQVADALCSSETEMHEPVED